MLLQPNQLLSKQRHVRANVVRAVQAQCLPEGVATAATWKERRRERTLADVVQVGRRLGPGHGEEALREGLCSLEALIPGFIIDLDRLSSLDWARVLGDPSSAAQRLLLLRSHYRRLDLSKLVALYPRVLRQPLEEIDRNATQVRQLLATADDIDAILEQVPQLTDPRTLISVLITVKKWYFNKKDPVAVLQADPDIIRRAQENDTPFEPVYTDAQGRFEAPSLNYDEKRTDWQKYIDQKVYKQE